MHQLFLIFSLQTIALFSLKLVHVRLFVWRIFWLLMKKLWGRPLICRSQNYFVVVILQMNWRISLLLLLVFVKCWEQVNILGYHLWLDVVNMQLLNLLRIVYWIKSTPGVVDVSRRLKGRFSLSLFCNLSLPMWWVFPFFRDPSLMR